MHVRISRVKRNGTTYCYAQLVESYRRPKDGMPAHRVVANLGRVTEVLGDNLKRAFAAGKRGKQVVVLDQDAARTIAPQVAFNRDFLDVLACHELWNHAGFQDVLQACLPKDRRRIPTASIIESLVIQRCVAPSSKLSACQWFPRTALPEVLGVAPAQFNNTRLHRALTSLEDADTAIQETLAEQFRQRQAGPATAFFIDVTDTWFEGRGPEIAQRGKTKEGFVRRKIGIVLLCDERGLPLRWKLVEGRTDDGVAMLGLLRELDDANWLGEGPLVCDRALGNSSDLRELDRLAIAYVTSLCANEHEAFGTLQDRPALLARLDVDEETATQRAAAAVVEAGWERVSEDLYVRDLQVVARDDVLRDERLAALRPSTEAPDRARALLEEGRAYQRVLDANPGLSQRGLAKRLGVSAATVSRRLRMLQLQPALQAAIEAGRARSLGKRAIEAVASVEDAEKQRVAFAEALEQAVEREAELGREHGLGLGTRVPVRARLVVTFNPALWATMRRSANRRVAKLGEVIEGINRGLGRAASGSVDEVLARAREAIQRLGLSDVYEAVAERGEDGRSRVGVRRDEGLWEKKRLRDGFSVLAAHPSVTLPAGELARLYRSKDAVEKDFQTIKSVLALRPLRHREDTKVRAHVTLCVLALALERLLERRLAEAGSPMTAARALEVLSAVKLNGLRLLDSAVAVHTVTEPDETTRGLAESLGIGWAFDDERVRRSLHEIPGRASVVPTEAA